MKNILYLLAIITLQSSCRKDVPVCIRPTELTDRNHLVDPTSIGSQRLNDTLAAHPEFQVYQIHDHKTDWVAKCNVFYKDLKVFTSQCYWHGTPNTIYSHDTLDFSSINFSLSPTITSDSAIHIAREAMNFNHTCISYRLGIYDINADRTKNYKLVWKIQGDNGYPFVYLDANTGEVYSKFDGIRT